MSSESFTRRLSWVMDILDTKHSFTTQIVELCIEDWCNQYYHSDSDWQMLSLNSTLCCFTNNSTSGFSMGWLYWGETFSAFPNVFLNSSWVTNCQYMLTKKKSQIVSTKSLEDSFTWKYITCFTCLIVSQTVFTKSPEFV